MKHLKKLNQVLQITVAWFAPLMVFLLALATKEYLLKIDIQIFDQNFWFSIILLFLQFIAVVYFLNYKKWITIETNEPKPETRNPLKRSGNPDYSGEPETNHQGRTPKQVETTIQILEWLLFGVVFAGFVALMWKLGTLTWNFFKLII